MLLTALCLGVTFYVIGEKFLRNLAVQELSRSSRQALFIVETFFINRKAEQATLAKSSFFFRDLDHETIRNRFEDYRFGYRMYQDISFYDQNRVRRIDLTQLDLGIATRQNELLIGLIEHQGPFIRSTSRTRFAPRYFSPRASNNPVAPKSDTSSHPFHSVAYRTSYCHSPNH